MITGISINNYKAIRQMVNVLDLGRFHVLVGPNASGKSTFLDAIDFVRDCLQEGPLKAVESRVPTFRDLTYMRQGGEIEIELWLDMGNVLKAQADNLVSYKLSIREDEKFGVSVADESLRQYSKSWLPAGKPFGFSPKVKPKRLLGKTSTGTDFYQREDGKYQDNFVFGMDKLALSLTPPDEERYPTGNVVKKFLMQGIRYIQLNSRAMRLPCPATRSTELELDGANLARVVGRLRGEAFGTKQNSKKMEAFERWTDHLKYALDDLQEIGWAKREPDNAEYLMIKYTNGLKCPSWLLSDGTLRMLAMTLLAFLPPTPGLYMVEEPENGVHPKALEIILRSLSAIPGGQMLVATHSPLVVQYVGKDDLLCFSRGTQGTEIIYGANHPAVNDWDGLPDLATIFASGVLG